ncbi:MAG: branched-chain-amino-acid transaminase [Thermaerobacter sp.]|nr:branched-chain-amino-acid transaminase [Thermaerobacter sp.]
MEEAELQIFMNGELVPANQAKVSVFDHGFLYGDGIFEGIRAYAGRVFKLEEHLDRLFDSSKAIMLTIPYGKAELMEAVAGTIRANGLTDAYVRLVVSRGPGDLGLDPTKCPHPTVVVIADRIALYPADLYQKGLSLASVAIRRPGGDVLNPAVKSLNYLNNIMAKIEANLRGMPEVLLMNNQGYVVEGTGDNVFLVRHGELWTPPVNAGILNGITRQVVLALADDLGLVCHEDNFNLFDVYTADECFLTGTAAEIIPAVWCDGRAIGNGQPGPVTQRLSQSFYEYSRTTGYPVYGSAGQAATA